MAANPFVIQPNLFQYRPSWLSDGLSLLIFSGIGLALAGTQFGNAAAWFILAAVVYQLIAAIKNPPIQRGSTFIVA